MDSPAVLPDRPVDGLTVDAALANAFDALDECGIAWAVLRDADELQAPSGDVDILVDPGAAAELDAVLLDAGFGRIRAPGHGSHRFYVSYDATDDRWIELDVVTEVSFGARQQ